MLIEVLVALVAWCVLSVPLAVVVGRALGAEGRNPGGPEGPARADFTLVA